MNALNYSVTGLPAYDGNTQGGGNSLLLQKTSGNFYIVVWNEPQIWDQAGRVAITPSTVPVTVNFGSTFGTVNVYDPLVGSTRISQSTNISSINLNLVKDPLIIELIAGGGAVCQFDPSQLDFVSQYQAVLDGSTVAWSGSNFTTTANAGSLGGNLVTRTGTAPVQGTALNGFNTINLSGNNSVNVAGKNWSGDVYVFGVFAMPGNTFELASMGWGPNNNPANGTSGWVIYPRINASGTVNGVNYGAGDLFADASGNNAGQPNMMATTPIADAGQHINSYQMGSADAYRKDGSVVTLKNAQTGSVAALSNKDVVFGGSGDNTEFGVYTAAYLLVGNPPSAGDIQKLEGWAAWRFGLTASLPGGHPYKAAAPTCASGTLAFLNVPGSLSVTQNVGQSLSGNNISLTSYGVVTPPYSVTVAADGGGILTASQSGSDWSVVPGAGP